jgi:hypothetical protein
MKCVVAIVALLIGAPLAALGATTVSVGGVLLQIPEPDGYVAVTPQMSETSRVLAQFVPPTNVELVAFIPKDEAPIAARGELPDTARYFIVEIARSIIYREASSSDFAEVKNNVSDTIQETARRVEQQFPDLMKSVNNSITKKYGVDFGGATVSAVPLPIHTDSSNTFAYSMFVKYKLKAGHGHAPSNAMVVTTTFVNIRGKILFLYCYSRSGNLVWSRSASKDWAKAVIDANR